MFSLLAESGVPYNRLGIQQTPRKVSGMIAPDPRDLMLAEDVLVEHNPADGETAWWLLDGADDHFRYWERVVKTSRPEVAASDGIQIIPVRAWRFRRRLGAVADGGPEVVAGLPPAESAVLPTGELVEKCARGRTDLALVRAMPDQPPLDLERIRTRWPAAEWVREVGSGLFLVSGVESGASDSGQDVAALLECPRARAEKLLASARAAGDRRREASVLTDLAVMSMNDGDSRRALDRLKEALAIARDLGDPTAEADVVGNFGVLSLTLDDPGLATQLFERELGFARGRGDLFAEKTALEHLGLARARLGDRSRALRFFEHALTLARVAGDRQHEAVLLWQQAVQHAELGQREQAIAGAESAIGVARGIDAPQAELLSAHLQRYCDGGNGGAGNASNGRSVIGGTMFVSAAPHDAGPSSAAGTDSQGPGLLRQGLAAARSVTRFVASGLKLTDADSLRKRLDTCSTCEHHTGLRCKVCGCFTNVKTRMASETCPAGKWSS
jgi:tetratricopeptide (TPR) repeat protein